jgi:hypothetical protein
MKRPQTGVYPCNEHPLRHRQPNHRYHHHPLNGEREIPSTASRVTTNGCVDGGGRTVASSNSSNKKNQRRRDRKRREQQFQVTQNGTQVFLPRMILRNMPYHQSNNQCQVIHTNKRKDSTLFRLLLSDWFHVLLRIKMHYSICMLLGLWLGTILLFAIVYVGIDHVYENADCGLGKEPPILIAFAAAFAFSLETCTTVGCEWQRINGWINESIIIFLLCKRVVRCEIASLVWSLASYLPLAFFAFWSNTVHLWRSTPSNCTGSFEYATHHIDGLPGNSNAFFESNCNGVLLTIFFQMTWSMLFNAFLFAFFYSQLSKSERRSLQLVFSDKLCINISKEGRVCASVQCYDIDSAFPVVEAHARMYMIEHKLQMNPLRLTTPDDNLGGMRYPSIPQKIIHHIDHHSALAPTRGHLMPLLASSQFNNAIPLRSCDSAHADRPEIICPVCGDSFGTYERLAHHVRFNKMIERQESYPIQDSHQDFEMPDTSSPLTLQEVTDHIETTMSEIVVVVEGIDPQLSGTFQAIQSYKYEDLVFGADHEPCTSVTTGSNKISVGMRTFHKIRYTDEGRRHTLLLSSFSSNSGEIDESIGDDSPNPSISVESSDQGHSSPQLPKPPCSLHNSQGKTILPSNHHHHGKDKHSDHTGCDKGEHDGLHIPVRIETTVVEEDKKCEENIVEALDV